MSNQTDSVPAILSPVRWIGAGILGTLREMGQLARFSGNVIAAALTPRWYAGEIWRQIVKMGFYSLPVVGLAAIFIGAALALNIYTGGARFNAEQFVPNIVVLGITRELGPTITALMLAGRVTAGIAAEIGAMKVTEQIDALRTLSANPTRYLYAPRLIAGVLTLPVLVFVADVIGVAGGWIVGVGSLGFDSTIYLRNTIDFLEWNDILAGLIKAAVFGHYRATRLLSRQPIKRWSDRCWRRGEACHGGRGGSHPCG